VIRNVQRGGSFSVWPDGNSEWNALRLAWSNYSSDFTALQATLIDRLQPLLHPWLNNSPIRQENDEKHLSHRSFGRV
jgi:hypothetical protein